MSEKRKVKPVPLFLDNPVDVDTLGVEQLAHTIAGAAIGNPGPFTIGVFGGWGKGKTSVLQIARSLLQDKATWSYPVATVWFNAWQHEREDHPLFSLIAAIVDGLEKEADRLTGSERSLEGKAKRGFKNAALSLRALTRGMKFSGKVGMPLVGEVGVEFDAGKALAAEDLLGKQNHPLIGELLYHKAFEGLGNVTEKFRKDLSNTKHGLHANVVVFIDDLDRCNPERALHLLEGVKLILAQPGFVFVMGIDRSVIEKYLEHVYEEKYKIIDEGRGQRYLDKMVQLALSLPQHGRNLDAHLVRLLENFKSRLLPDSELRAAFQIVERNQQAVLAGASGNPRALVRLLNGFLVDCQLWEGDADFSLNNVAGALIFHRLLEANVSEEAIDHAADISDFWVSILEGQAEKYLGVPEPGEIGRLRGSDRAQREIASVLVRQAELAGLLSNSAKMYATSHELRKRIRVISSQYFEELVNILPEYVLWQLDHKGFDYSASIARDGLKRIKTLDISYPESTVAEIKIVVEYMPNLEELYLAGDGASSEALKIINSQLPQLKVLKIMDSNVNDDDIPLFINAFSKLEDLEIFGTSITAEGANKIETARPYLTVRWV